MDAGATSGDLAVVVVNWNGGELTRRALDSLVASTRRPELVVVVDNGSTDGSAEGLEGAGRVLIRNRENRGFAAACNQGIRHALERGCAWVFLLNNDAEVDPGALAALLDAAARRPEAGLFAGKILFPDGETLWCAGVDVGWHPNCQDLRGNGRPDRGAFDREEAVDALTGCGLLCRAEVLRELGGLDERYFVYVEDVDLCLRARDAGWTSVYVPAARMTHAASSSTGGGYGAWRKRMLAYNVALFVRRRRSPALWCAHLAFDVLGWPLLFLLALPRGRARAALAKGEGTMRGLLGLARPAAPGAP